MVALKKASRRFLVKSAAVAPVLLMAGCSGIFRSKPKPSTFSLMLSASSSVNPDIEGRPSPIWVRFYQLRSIGVFKNAEFETLFANDSVVLGAEMLERSEFVLTPDQTIEVTDLTMVHEDARFLGVIAAYRDINLARWRDSIAIEPLNQNLSVMVALDRLMLRLKVEPA